MSTPPPPGSVWSHLTDISKYWKEIDAFLGVIKGAGRLAVGQSEPVPPIKVEQGGHHYTWAGSAITKDS